MFGYTRSELEGRNVSMLVPYAQHHDGYLQRYITTGQPHILGANQRLIGLHKVGNRGNTCVPVYLFTCVPVWGLLKAHACG